MKFFPTVVGVVANQSQLLGAVLNVVVYGLQGGAILVRQARLFCNSPRLFHDRSCIFENVQQFHGGRHPIG